MRKWIALLTAVACLAGFAATAGAEKGFENLYGLYSDENVFGEPWRINDMTEGSDGKICMALFMFDPDNDMTMAVLLGAGADGVNKYYIWGTGYEKGAIMMSFLLGRFAELKAECEEGVEFCISYTFDGGENTMDITTEEMAEQLTAMLQQGAAEPETDGAAAAP